jgi:hypothetical protein
MLNVLVKEIIQSETAVTSVKAELVFEVLKTNIKNGEISVLDFTGVKSLTTAFLNIAIGQLYDLESPDKLTQMVKIRKDSVSDEHMKKIIRVLSNSKEKREVARKNIEEVLDGE